jgi:hypothetical protein
MNEGRRVMSRWAGDLIARHWPQNFESLPEIYLGVSFHPGHRLSTAMRPTANPVPKTQAAREALRSFYCDLCDRGYSRINEYEAHLSRFVPLSLDDDFSYTHTHKKVNPHWKRNLITESQRDESFTERYVQCSSRRSS